MQLLSPSYVSESGAGKSTESSGSPPAAKAQAFSSSQPVYEYKYFPPGEDWFPSPMIPVALQAPTGVIVPTWAYADTGADSTALPFDYAEGFGIDLEGDCEKKQGMTASDRAAVQYVYSPGLMAQIEDIQLPLAATFMDTPVVLLGQEDFFKRFEVTFDHRAQRVLLKPYPKQLKGP